MQIERYPDERHWVLALSAWCEAKIRDYAAQSIFIPAGQTPLPLYKYWEQHKPSYLENLKLLQIDEILDSQNSHVFRNFLSRELSSFSKQIEFIHSANQVADLAILGIGLNGHVAFHEPGIPAHFTSGCVKLSDQSCASLKIVAGTWGLTYGLGTFMKAKALVLAVRGKSKSQVLKHLLSHDTSIPASTLLDHKDLTIITDYDASSGSFE